MKYPKKYKGKKVLIKVPIKLGVKTYKSFFINPDGSIGLTAGIAEHHTELSCWVCCNAYNRRVGYKKRHVNKILKKWAKHTKRNIK